MNWIYNNTELIIAPDNAFGFIYKITCNTSGKMYIGKKQFISVCNVPLNKKDILIHKEGNKRGRVPKKKQVIKPSNWLKYWGSNTDLLSYIKEQGKENFTREILKICNHKKQLTYYENKYLYSLGVLENELYFNSNIQGKFYPEDV